MLKVTVNAVAVGTLQFVSTAAPAVLQFGPAMKKLTLSTTCAEAFGEPFIPLSRNTARRASGNPAKIATFRTFRCTFVDLLPRSSLTSQIHVCLAVYPFPAEHPPFR